MFTSNVFAILGLRAMYFLLAGAVERFHLLKYASLVAQAGAIAPPPRVASHERL